jgi:hypothetical protein
MEKRTMHIFGENVIDFEGVLGSKLTGGASLTTEHLTLPVGTGLRINDNNKYYGKILVDTDRMTLVNGHSIRIPVDKKYDLDGIILSLSDAQLAQWMKDEHITNFLDIILTGKNGGGGAHNSAYCAQVYLNSSQNLPLEIRLVVPDKSSFIEQSLPSGLHYDSILSNDDALVRSNLNISLEYGKKLTFRSRKANYIKYNIDAKKIKDNDIIVIDSIKDSTYIDAVNQVLDSKPGVDFYLAATDSMINKLGRNKVYELALKSDLYVSNSEEFDMLMNKNISDDVDLANKLGIFQNEQKFINGKNGKNGKAGTIVVTYGDLGSIICDKNSNIYFQSVASAPKTTPFVRETPIVNTSGCGDAYFAMMAVGHAIGYGTSIKLNYSNAVGHLCAFKPTATDPTLSTNSDIENYRRNFSNAPIYCYNQKSKKFEPIGL